MDYDLREFLEEFDDYTGQVRRAKLNIFQARLAQWFDLVDNGDESVSRHTRWLSEQIDWPKQRTAIFNDGGSIALPSKKLARLAAYLHVMREINLGTLEFLPFLDKYFQRGRNVQDQADNFIDQFYKPFSSELRRYIERYFDQELPEESDIVFETASAQMIAASDRLVPINHNAPAYQSLLTGLEGLEEQLRGANSLSTEDRELALSEVAAIQGLLKPRTIRLGVVAALVIPALSAISKLLFDTIGAELINHTVMPSLKVLFPELLG